MGSTSVWRRARRALLAARAAAPLVLGAAGCREQIVAPGRCPALCPSQRVQVVDTLLTGVVVSDSSFRGFVAPHEATFFVTSNRDSLQSVGLVRFARRGFRWFPPGSTDTAGVRIGSLDSVMLEIRIENRDTSVKNVRLLLYRLPAQFDTAASLDSMLPYFADSLLVDSIVIPDSLGIGAVVTRLPALEIPQAEQLLEADSGVLALGFVLRAAGKTALAVLSDEVPLSGPRLSYYARAPAPDTLTHVFGSTPSFDTFVYAPAPPDSGAVLVAGGLPSARTIMRFNLPRVVVDSMALVRATLILTPAAAATGFPNERFPIQARAVVRDAGAKSVLADTVLSGSATVTAGSTAPVEIDIGRILRFWGGSSGDSLPRTLVILGGFEGAQLGEVRLARRTAGVDAPKLKVTYVLRYPFGVP